MNTLVMCSFYISSKCVRLIYITILYLILIKVKLSLYRTWRPVGLREVEAPAFSDIQLIDGSKVASRRRWLLFTPRKIPGAHFC
jgi:hypothetical protein